MSRTLAAAGLIASGLHVVVLAAVASWSDSGQSGPAEPRPLRIGFVELPAPAATVEPIEAEAQVTEIETEQPPAEADADEPVEPALVEAEPIEIESETEVKVSEDVAAPAPFEESVVQNTESPVAPTAAVIETPQAPAPLEAARVVHRLASAPPSRLLALLTPNLQRAAARPVKQSPPPVASAPPSAPRGERIDPVLEHRPKPAYPAVARRRGYEGTVVLRIEVLENGRVGDVQVRQSSGYDVLDRQAERTVRQHWRFRPGRLDGRVAALWVDIPIEFHLIDS
ncbi:MAG: energy transducer TonB [Phycisphaerales bacterium]|nr:energy transducer TonB [Phycisphaerales bacterium]